MFVSGRSKVTEGVDVIIGMVLTHDCRPHILHKTIDVKLPLMEHKIDRVIADEAATGLAREQLLLQRGPLLGVECGKIL